MLTAAYPRMLRERTIKDGWLHQSQVPRQHPARRRCGGDGDPHLPTGGGLMTAFGGTSCFSCSLPHCQAPSPQSPIGQYDRIEPPRQAGG